MPDKTTDPDKSTPHGTAPELPEELRQEISDEPESETTDTSKPAETEDPGIDEAVDDIVSKEGDTVLAVEDAKRKRLSVLTGGRGWKDKVKAIAKDRRFQVGTVVLLLIIFALPVTRYKVLGLVIKKDVTVSVVDSKTSTPVSGATVTVGGASGKTDGNGKVTVKAKPGKTKVEVSKQYYKQSSQPLFVGLKNSSTALKLNATGRLVPISVVNKITGKPLVNAQIKVLGTTAKTDSKGKATIALPTNKGSQSARLSLNGYNTSDITIQVTDKAVKGNNFELTASGQIYFLSNRSGKLDVVKSNLDGSGRKTVLEGTGTEEPNTTSLLASRDWKYLVLKSRREGAQASLYLIDTKDDKVTQFDNGDADFTLVGWYGHSFIYSLARKNLAEHQSGRIALKSYDAEKQQLNLLDQNQAEGAAGSYAYQNFFNFYIVNNAIVYNTQWYTFAADAAGKTDSIRAVQPGGQNKKDYQTFPTATTGYIQAALYAPQKVYFAVYDNSANKLNYYEFENQSVKGASVEQSKFDNGYPTYLLSPSGNQTFWTELRDGKNTLFTGDANAESKKQIATLSDYTPYGWYSDAYIMVAKNSSELYIMPAGGLAAGKQPIKITDYYKPAQTYQGYGYGGL